MKFSHSKNLFSSHNLLVALLLIAISSISFAISADETVIVRCVRGDMDCIEPDPGGGGGIPIGNPGVPAPVGPGVPSIPAPTPPPPPPPPPEETEEDCIDNAEREHVTRTKNENNAYQAALASCLVALEIPALAAACGIAMTIAHNDAIAWIDTKLINDRAACR